MTPTPHAKSAPNFAPTLPSLESLRIFLAAAQTRRLNEAAERLGLTPSAVSQSIRRLEQDLDVVLFDREVRPLRLTTAGERLQAEVPGLLAAAAAVTSAIRSPEHTRLRLGLGETVTATIGPWLIARLAENISHLETTTRLTKPLVEALAAERIDVLISPDGRLDDERWARRALYRERFLLVGPRGHALPERVADLRIYGATRPFIGYTPESSDHDEAERLLRILDVAPERRIAVSSSYALVGLVAELGGWSLVPATNLWCGQAFAARLKVARVPGDMQVTRTMWAVADAGSRLPELELTAAAAQAVVREHLAGALASVLPELAGEIEVLSGA